MGDGRTRVAVQHDKLDGPGAVEFWQGYWAAWLDVLAMACS